MTQREFDGDTGTAMSAEHRHGCPHANRLQRGRHGVGPIAHRPARGSRIGTPVAEQIER